MKGKEREKVMKNDVGRYRLTCFPSGDSKIREMNEEKGGHCRGKKERRKG